MFRMTNTRPVKLTQTCALSLFFLGGVLIGPAFPNADVQVNWEPSPDEDLAGYKVLLGTTPTSNQTIQNVGLTESHVFQDLDEGKTYYFMVTAYDQMGNESAPSEQVDIYVPDLTSPSTPEDLSLSSASGQEVAINWSPSTDNVGVTAYEVARDGVSIGQSPTTTFFDSAVAPGNSYTYTVKASDASGNTSAWSAALPVTIEASDTSAPTVPQNLTLDGSSESQVAFSWAPSTDNVGVTSYEIARNNVLIGLTGSASYVDTTISAGNSYAYTVRAKDASDNTSAWSAALPVTIEAPDTSAPTVPQNLTLDGSSESQVAFSWAPSTDNVGVTGYEIARDNVLIGLAGSTTFTDTTISAGNSYAYTVRAKDASDNTSAWSAALPVTIEAPDTSAPTVPQNLTLNSVSETQVAFGWTASTDNVGVTGYRVARNNSVIGQTTATTFTDSTASPGITYSYTVQAMDAEDNASGWSQPLGATTPSGLATLSVSTSGNGTVTSSPNGINCIENQDNCTGTFPLGTVVTLTPTAGGKGWSFSGWSGSCTGTEACTLTMNGDRNVTAQFSKGSKSDTGDGGGGNGGGKGGGKGKPK